MYSAKHFASLPVSIGSPATSHVGSAIDGGSFACSASAAIASGVMWERTDDELLLEAVLHGAAAVEAHDHRDDPERERGQTAAMIPPISNTLRTFAPPWIRGFRS